MTESEYWENCRLLSSEIDDVTAFFHTHEEMHRLASEDDCLLEALNADALFWRTQRLSLQAAFMIGLGRIFDGAPDAYSIHKVVRATQRHPEFFSKEAFAARRSPNEVRPNYLDEFMKGVWEPKTDVLQQLEDELAKHNERFKSIYRPIRHAIFAHRLVNSKEAVFELFAKTDRKELEGIIDFLRDLIEQIEQLYMNGKRPELGLRSNDRFIKEIRASTRNAFSKIVAACRLA